MRLRLRDDFEHYAPRALKIRTKGAEIKPLTLNKAQAYVHGKLEEQKARTGRVRALVLKGRQQGMSTYIAGRFYHLTTHRRGIRTFILTHEDAATSNLFDMVNRYHQNCPDVLRPSTGASNAKELLFEKLDSGYKIGTAGTKGVGRSSTVQLFHGSEAGYWPNAESHAAGIMQAVPDEPGTEIILESTANGVGNLFHQMWRAAEAGIGDYQAIFVPWFWQDEYKKIPPPDFVATEEELQYAALWGLDLQQIVWRRAKIAELRDADLFKQEYPACILAGERVGTDRGLLRIEDVRSGDQGTFGPITAAWQSGVKPVFAVHTERGFVVKCTADHRIMTQDGSWVEASDLVGQSIALATPRFAETEVSVDFSDFDICESRINITEEVGLFLGYFMGDGSYHDDTLSIVCDGSDADVVENVRSLIERLFRSPSIRLVGPKKGGAEVRLHDRRTLRLLQALDLVKRRASGGWKRRVHVPDCIWCSPKPVVRAFLSGLFEADGFSSREGARVILFAKDVEFLRDVQRLLLGFGIVATVRVIQKVSSGYTYEGAEMRLTRNAAIAFSEQIGFRSQRKQSRVMSRAANRGRPPIVEGFVDKVICIEPLGMGEVYDLTVEGTHMFDASGVVVHNCSTEAFLSSGQDNYITPPLIVKARKTHFDEGNGPLVIGYDPAWTGGDRHAMAWRRGRKLIKVEFRRGLDTMQAAGWCRQVLEKERPAKLFVDVGGVGAGVYDRLKEMGFSRKVTAINFGSSPEDQPPEGGGALNRRAEMWMRSKEWLQDPAGADIPDDDALQADACSVGYTYDSRTRLQLESKDKLRARGVPSPDGWDAVALTFAEHVRPDADTDGPTRDYRSDAKIKSTASWLTA
jgi:hypothetical protein